MARDKWLAWWVTKRGTFMWATAYNNTPDFSNTKADAEWVARDEFDPDTEVCYGVERIPADVVEAVERRNSG